ncbi:MAG TPA: phage integrase N-terminal SAM-like domain-containing protein [Bryobacteraceae bacterium]|nr:phage integrase N-terminal SAM-like domain-containing protein [Bryobacteraceae bacterium]
MTTILERMREKLVRRNYAANTIHSYRRILLDFERYVSKPLEEVDADDVRSYHAYLLDQRKLAVRAVVQRVAAIRFLYCTTLKRRDMKEDLPYPSKYRRRLPVILGVEEVAQVIDCARNLFHRALLMTLFQLRSSCYLV